MHKVLCFFGIHKLYHSGLFEETLVNGDDLFIYPKKFPHGFWTTGKCKYCDKQIVTQDDVAKKISDKQFRKQIYKNLNTDVQEELIKLINKKIN